MRVIGYVKKNWLGVLGLKGKPMGDPVFSLPDKPIKMIQQDLETAKAAWVEATVTRG